MFNSTHLHAALRRMSCGFLPLLIVMAGFTATADAQVRPDAQDYVVNEAGEGRFPIASSGTPAPIFADDAVANMRVIDRLKKAAAHHAI